MSANSSGSTRALVLGGGGPVGIGWQIGLLTGLREAGLDLSEAEVIVGTSAGSVTGAMVASRADLSIALRGLTSLDGAMDSAALVAGTQALMTAMEQAGMDTDPRQGLIRIGKAAEQADTVDEQTYLDLYSVVADAPWPGSFRCTATDTRSGELVVWGPDSGVPLQRAVASSCAVPLVYPTVSLGGRRCMDGGLVSHLNTPAALPADRIIAISCFPLAASVPGMPAWIAATVKSELTAVGETSRLATVEPRGGLEGGDLANVMDPRLAPDAYALGLRQAEWEADRLTAVWTGQPSAA